MKENKNKILKILITIQLLILPFLDMLRTTSFKDIEVFNFAIIELINILLIGISFIITFFKIDKRKFIKIFTYLLLVGVYLILHYNNIIKFDVTLFKEASFNFYIETFYILRVYVLPMILLFVLYENKDIFNKEYYFKIIKIVIAIISLSIIILNILKLSYISYSASNRFIEKNIFDYFAYSGNFKMLTSRGWFDSANEISAITFMLLPINIYLLFKEKKNSNIALYIAQSIAMILLGTRTSAMGTALISVTIMIIYLITLALKKDKFHKKIFTMFVISMVMCMGFLAISPFALNKYKKEKTDFTVKDQQAYTSIRKNVNKISFAKLFKKYKKEYLIKDVFLKMYPLENDLEFWHAIAKRNKALNNDSRRMKTDIISRIEYRNNNKYDKWLGLGKTLNFMDLERDYVYQYYLYGIIGLILFIVPYFYLLLRNIIRTLINLKEKFNLEVITSFMPIVLGLIIAYYSGHVFGWVSPMFYLVMLLVLNTIVVEENRND